MKICNFCGSGDYEERKTEYLYSHKGQYLLVPQTPCEVCLDCGMVYYHPNCYSIRIRDVTHGCKVVPCEQTPSSWLYVNPAPSSGRPTRCGGDWPLQAIFDIENRIFSILFFLI